MNIVGIVTFLLSVVAQSLMSSAILYNEVIKVIYSTTNTSTEIMLSGTEYQVNCFESHPCLYNKLSDVAFGFLVAAYAFCTLPYAMAVAHSTNNLPRNGGLWISFAASFCFIITLVGLILTAICYNSLKTAFEKNTASSLGLEIKHGRTFVHMIVCAIIVFLTIISGVVWWKLQQKEDKKKAQFEVHYVNGHKMDEVYVRE